MSANTKNQTEIISTLKICPGKAHRWVRARILQGKEKGRIIEVRKPC